MMLPEWLRLDGSRSLSTAKWGVLGGTFVLLVIVIALVMGPSEVARADRPYADWKWETTAEGDVVLVHEGGDTIPRKTLRIQGDALNGTITNLGDGADERIVQPFDDSVVSEGDTLVINADFLNEGPVVLLWKSLDGTRSATLAQLDYPTDFNETPRSENASG